MSVFFKELVDIISSLILINTSNNDTAVLECSCVKLILG